jgi:aspartate racemase
MKAKVRTILAVAATALAAIRMKHIGILAHSFEGAALCYRAMCLEGLDRLGPHQHPELTLTGRGMAEVLDEWERLDLPALQAFFRHDIQKLAAADCDFFVCPDNTAHIALESEGDAFQIDGAGLSRCLRPARD